MKVVCKDCGCFIGITSPLEFVPITEMTVKDGVCKKCQIDRRQIAMLKAHKRRKD